MRVPSGDHSGDRSWAPGLAVRLRASPFSAGTVTISPRNSKTARAPDGEMPTLRMYSGPLTNRARVSRRSAGTGIARRFAEPLAGSSRCSQPACSYTIFPPPAEAFSTGKSSCFVIRRTCFDEVSNA